MTGSGCGLWLLVGEGLGTGVEQVGEELGYGVGQLVRSVTGLGWVVGGSMEWGGWGQGMELKLGWEQAFPVLGVGGREAVHCGGRTLARKGTWDNSDLWERQWAHLQGMWRANLKHC
jgi:hypothetical protein